MRRRVALGAAGLAVALVAAGPPPSTGKLTAEAGLLVLETGGRRLTSRDLVGAALVVPVVDGAGRAAGTVEVRIDAVRDAADAPGVPLYEMSVGDGAPLGGGRQGFCTPDARGRNAAYAMRGRIDEAGRFVADPGAFFLACTSGAVGKCVLWGYDPWRAAPGGGTLARHYEACLRAARADYAGDGEPHTRDGTAIDLDDDAGVQHWASVEDAGFAFEAAWGPQGAVCVARTRWPDLADLGALHRARPNLAGPCDRASAAARGALLFTRVKRDPGRPG